MKNPMEETKRFLQKLEKVLQVIATKCLLPSESLDFENNESPRKPFPVLHVFHYYSW